MKKGSGKTETRRISCIRKYEVFIYSYSEIDAKILPIFYNIVPMKFTPIKFEVMKGGYGVIFIKM